MKETNSLTYTQAVQELEAILKELEGGEIVNLDKIASHVKHATELMEFCKRQLHTIDEELRKMVEEL